MPPPEGSPGGGTGEGDGGDRRTILPRQAPEDTPHRVDGMLLIGNDGLLIVDAGGAALLGRWGAGKQVEIVDAASASEVAVVAFGPTEFSATNIPDGDVSRCG